jgi:hypothetical protein
VSEADLSRATWRKSTRSGAQSACVEVAVLGTTTTWRKSTRSSAQGACVEVATVDTTAPSNASSAPAPGSAHESSDTLRVAVRDSKNPDGPALLFTRREWEAFLGGVRDGQFDLG